MEASITSPTSPPYVAEQLRALFRTTILQLSSLLQRSTNNMLRILAQPRTQAMVTYYRSLAYDCKAWAYPVSSFFFFCGLSLSSKGYSTWSVVCVCLLLNITCLFVPQTILTVSAADKGRNFKRFPQARAFPVGTAA